MSCEHIHFVTGRLAERALREVVSRLAKDVDFQYSIDVLPITVAALMTPEWIVRHINVPPATDRVLVPGYCRGELDLIASASGAIVDRGPRDLRQLPAFFDREPLEADYGDYDIEIVAEINHCPRRTLESILSVAKSLVADGADVIDIGCDPGETWPAVSGTVEALCDQGYRVSIDSFNPREIEHAARAGAELVLSVNGTNAHAASDWGCEVVAIPDDPRTLAGLDRTVELLTAAHVPFRVDPVLEPIGFGFANSLGRYLKVRERYPDTGMLMGIGNLTELTDVDSAAINVLLLGFCQEVGIRSVLTTQVIPWAKTSVRECDLARRLVWYSITRQVLPKHLEPRLLTLRDAEMVTEPTDAELNQLSKSLRDSNYRLFSTNEELHLVASDLHLKHTDPFALFDQLLCSGRDGAPPQNVDLSHAFYLGYELCKAATAQTLGKQYEQDEPLDWGYLTRDEVQHRL